jgi:two-component system, NarL family, invasion response regulator UvrY
MSRILIVDDHAIVRRGLKQIVSEAADMNVVAEAANGQEALDKVRQGGVDLVLLDISMPGRGGMDTLRRLKREHPRLPVLILSIYPEDQYAVRALKDGASGYLTKDSDPEELIVAIHKVVQGRKYVSTDLAEKLADGLERSGNPPHETLSDREYQVMLMLASGRTVGEIAKELSLSIKTISTNRTRLLRKMAIKTNAELAYYAIKQGLIE